MYQYSWTFFFRFVVLRENGPPAYNWTTNAWGYTSYGTSPWVTAPNFVRQSTRYASSTWTFPATNLTQGVTYRVWGIIDSGVGDTDRGDNMFPTGITIRRP